MDGGGEGADRRREFRRGREHIRGRAAAWSGEWAADCLATPGVEGSGRQGQSRVRGDVGHGQMPWPEVVARGHSSCRAAVDDLGALLIFSEGVYSGVEGV